MASDGVEILNEQANLARVQVGWQDGDLFRNPNLAPSMEVVNGIQPTVMQKLDSQMVTEAPILDPWVSRRPNANV